MKSRFALTLTDISPRMLEQSRAINPECEHVACDMRTARMGRVFDAVFVHDAIMYMTTEDDLRAVIETAAQHCAPGGVVLLVPDFVREGFVAGTDDGGHDDPSGDRGLRFFEWVRDPDPSDTQFRVDYVVMMREGETMTVEHEVQFEGLFPRDVWISLMREQGLTVTTAEGVDWEGHEKPTMFIGVKPGGPE